MMSHQRLTAAAAAVLFCLSSGGCREQALDSQATAAAVDNEARQACATLTAGYRHAGSAPRRLALADRVTRWSARSDNPAIVRRGAMVGMSADHSNRSWRGAVTQFLRVCERAGWRPVQTGR